MRQDSFSRRDVERAFRKFRDLESDLFNSVYQTWWESFIHLLAHCENNPVMQAIVEPLKNNPNVNAVDWFEDFMKRGSEGADSFRYSLPKDDTDKTALIYQFMMMIEKEGEHFLINFCSNAYEKIGSSIEEDYSLFNREIIYKFTREMKYRIDDINIDIGSKDQVSKELMLVFNNYGNIQNVTGGIQENNIAFGSSHIDRRTIPIDEIIEIKNQILSIKKLVSSGIEVDQNKINNDIETLIKSIEGGNTPSSEIVKSVESIASISDKAKDILKDISKKSLINATTANLGKAIDYVFSHAQQLI